MYSKRRIVQKYLYYLFSASSGKGHGIHSPFVFDFVANLLSDRSKDLGCAKIENLRQQLLKDNRMLHVEDFGAGSGTVKTRGRSIADIARNAAKSKKYARLIFRIARYYKARNILELGSSLGISAAYLATANPEAKVFTLEGDPETAEIAAQNFRSLGISNIQLIKGNFDTTLPAVLEKMNSIDLAFIDGNHREAPTLAYFNWLLPCRADHSIFIFDDIHWSREMENAWEEIKKHPSVLLTIDLFFLGWFFSGTNSRLNNILPSGSENPYLRRRI